MSQDYEKMRQKIKKEYKEKLDEASRYKWDFLSEKENNEKLRGEIQRLRDRINDLEQQVQELTNYSNLNAEDKERVLRASKIRCDMDDLSTKLLGSHLNSLWRI